MSLISVIIPCYNQGRFLSEAVLSVLEQEYTNWECIIINDGSTDNTRVVCEHWEAVDDRIQSLSKSNGGLSSARNAGIRLSKGRYLQFLDADDLLEPTKFLKQIQALQGQAVNTVAICDHFPFDNQTGQFMPRMYKQPFLSITDFKKEIVSEWEFRRSIPPHNPLVPRNLVIKNGISFNESLQTHEDWAFWCQVFYNASAICYQHEKLVRFRMHASSMSNNKKLMAEGFLAATFIMENFYHNKGAKDLVSAVRKIRKEIKNNLFAHTALHNVYAEMWQRIKSILGPSAETQS